MTSDLFAEGARLERIPMQDADVLHLRHLELAQPLDRVLQHLIAEVPWRSEQVVLWGKKLPQPRLIAWYGDAGRSYAYSGIRLDPMPWTPTLLDVKPKVEAVA